MSAGLTVQGLTVRYGRHLVLSGIDLAPMARGQLVGLIGANGAGKSTLLKALAGLVPASGRIAFEGQDLTDRRRTIGYLPQSLPHASALLAYEMVAAALQAGRSNLTQGQARQRIESVFDRLDIRPLALRRLAELSGGQRQMVGLAQVIVRQPSVLLLDEPTSALDLRWQMRVLATVQEDISQRDGLALIALHDINLALRFCPTLLVLTPDGVVQGAADQVLTPDLLRRTYGVEGRVERCSQGFAIVSIDRALPLAGRREEKTA